MSTAEPVRQGHQLAVTAMAAPAFQEIVALFENDSRIGGTYFRLVENGFQPVDLDQLSSKPLIGIGPTFPPSASVDQLTKELDARVATLLQRRASAARSEEKQIEAKVMRWALCSHLGLPGGFPESLRFIASQWRIELGGKNKVVDVIAADRDTGGLVVIELKTRPDKKAKVQAAEYVTHVREHADVFGPFFSALGSAMAKLYSCRDMPSVVDAHAAVGLAAWPADAGYVVVRSQ